MCGKVSFWFVLQFAIIHNALIYHIQLRSLLASICTFVVVFSDHAQLKYLCESIWCFHKLIFGSCCRELGKLSLTMWKSTIWKHVTVNRSSVSTPPWTHYWFSLCKLYNPYLFHNDCKHYRSNIYIIFK